MTLLEIVRDEYESRNKLNGFECTTIKLCNEHNLALTEECKKSSRLFKATCEEIVGRRIYMLFNKPVIEESSKGRVKCFICDNIKRRGLEGDIE